jgi:hypothetical protein
MLSRETIVDRARRSDSICAASRKPSGIHGWRGWPTGSRKAARAR